MQLMWHFKSATSGSFYSFSFCFTFFIAGLCVIDDVSINHRQFLPQAFRCDCIFTDTIMKLCGSFGTQLIEACKNIKDEISSRIRNVRCT
jgi:hypothetical protein